MERIAPLAKILAEANGIEWQRIQGTGDDGTIVEQDILNYLSRVMSGEEDPPSTPVDLPPPDWNGEEVPSADMLNRAGMNADMLSRAGVDTDLTAFVEQTRTGSPQVPVAPVAEALDEDMEFELDDEPAAADEPADTEAPTPEPAPAPVHTPVHTPMPDVTPPVMAPVPVMDAPVTEAPVAAAPTPAPVEPPAAAAATGMGAGLGSLLSRLYQKPATPDAAAPVSTPAPEPAPAAPTPVAAELSPEPVHTEPVHMEPARQEPEYPAPADEPVPAAVEPEPVAPADDTPAYSEPVHVEPAHEPAPVEPTHAEPVHTEPVHTETVHTEPAHTEPMPVEPVHTEPAHTEPAHTEPVPPVHVPAHVPAPAGDSVWFGTYLRRDANVAALHDLRAQVSAALEQDLPLGLLLARAAQRHAQTLSLGSVALNGAGGRMHAVSSGSLRDALGDLDATHDGTPDLLIVDAGALGLDDLHFPQTVTLSVGRVQDGRAALSLNGNVDTERAAAFLAQVAGTLEQPILLVL